MAPKHEKDPDLHWDSVLCQDPDHHPKDPDPTFRIPNDQRDLDPDSRESDLARLYSELYSLSFFLVFR